MFKQNCENFNQFSDCIRSNYHNIFVSGLLFCVIFNISVHINVTLVRKEFNNYKVVIYQVGSNWVYFEFCFKLVFMQ